ncbi:MAG: CaiB/BaiF CoA transferase family protein [Acidimicrobiia bacterium]
MSRLLEGIRVLECGVLLNCDTVGMRLADMGADVVKVEPPPLGDYIRDINGVLAPRLSPVHLHINRNKRSVALDLRDAGDLEAFWALLDTADVFVDGLTAGASDRLGIGYAAQSDRKPSIVYCQYTGYGSTGPYSSLPTHGQMMDALAAGHPRQMGSDGLMTALHDGKPNGRSGGDGTSAGAMHAVTHILAGIIQRDRTGDGCFIDVASSDAVVAQAWGTVAMAMNSKRVIDPEHVPDQDGAGYSGAKYQFYETSDGKVMLFCAIEHRFWDAFCMAAGRPDLVPRKDETAPVDFGRDPALRIELQGLFSTKTQAEWMDLALAQRIPLGPAPRDFEEMLEDPHVRSRAIVVELEHPVAGRYTCTGEGAIVAKQPFELRRQAPAYGEHTDEILDELGITRTQTLVAADADDMSR